jgi:hypothetical protein
MCVSVCERGEERREKVREKGWWGSGRGEREKERWRVREGKQD